jgi:hypothetical protein
MNCLTDVNVKLDSHARLVSEIFVEFQYDIAAEFDLLDQIK